MSALETIRPTTGLIGSTFESGAPFAQSFLRTIDNYFDQGEGWTTIEGDTWSWYTGRLFVKTTVHQSSQPHTEFSEYAITTIVLAEGMQSLPTKAFNLLNDLNAQATGWIAWADPDEANIKISIRIPLAATIWWWQPIFLSCLPIALTAADANAQKFAELINGNVALRNHPLRGERVHLDTWIDGVRRGSREPSASLDLFLSSKDYSIIRKAMEELWPQNTIKMEWPFRVSVQDSNGVSFSKVEASWHPNLGRGWQFSSIESEFESRSLPEETLSAAHLEHVANRNLELATTDTWRAIMGGWVANSEFGYIRQMFFPAQIIEELLQLSAPTFGVVTALIHAMFESLYERPESRIETGNMSSEEHNEALSEATSTSTLRNAPLGWSFLLPPDDQPLHGTWDRGDLEKAERLSWLLPRHSLICSFGIFNPSGPTVSSLELSFDGSNWNLFGVIRHPFGGHIQLIGSCPITDGKSKIAEMITEALASHDDGVMGSGPDWMEVVAPIYTEAVLDGLRLFAERAPGTDWQQESKRIIAGQGNPWRRVMIAQDEVDLISVDETIDTWISLITEFSVVGGHQIYTRSAWEGSKFFAKGESEEAARVAKVLGETNEFRLKEDYAFRNGEGPYILHPVDTPLSTLD